MVGGGVAIEFAFVSPKLLCSRSRVKRYSDNTVVIGIKDICIQIPNDNELKSQNTYKKVQPIP